MFEDRLTDLDKVIDGYAEAEKAARTFLIKTHEAILGENATIFVDSLMESGMALKLLKTMQEEKKTSGNCDGFFKSLADKKIEIETTIRLFKQLKTKV